MLVSHQYSESAWSAEGTSFNPVISGDGSTIAFYSTAQNLTSNSVFPTGDGNEPIVELYVYNTATGVMTLASHDYSSTSSGSNGENPALPPSPSTHWQNTLGYSTAMPPSKPSNGLALPSLSYNGQYISYIDDATDLGGSNTGTYNDGYGDIYPLTNVFLYDDHRSELGLWLEYAGQPRLR